MALDIQGKMPWTIIFITVIGTGLGVDASKNSPIETNMPLEERAQYYFSKLRDTLMEMKGFKNNGFGLLQAMLPKSSKNQTDAALMNLVLHSLNPLCRSFSNIGEGSETNINIFNNSTVNFSTKSKKMKEKTETKGNGKGIRIGNGKEPKKENISKTPTSPNVQLLASSPGSAPIDTLIHPMNVTARRDGDMVTVTFNVSRSEAAMAAHTWTFEGQRKVLKGPRKYGLDAGTLISSDVDFVFNTSICRQKNNSNHDLSRQREMFAFSRKDFNLPSITAEIPTCFFDVEQDGFRRNKTENRGAFSQVLKYPTFWEDVTVSNLTTIPNDNISFDLKITLAEDDYFMINGIFYDPVTDEMNITNYVILSNNMDKATVQHHSAEGTTVAVLGVDIEHQEEFNGTVPGLEDLANSSSTNKHVTAMIKITIDLPNDRVSGLLNLHYSASFLPFIKTQGHGIVFKMQLLKQIGVLPPNQKDVFPDGKYMLLSPKRFACGVKNAYSRLMGGDDNICAVYCTVFGRGIRNMRLRKIKDGVVDPVTKFIEVDADSAAIYANLGATRKELDGDYECRAVRHNGKPRTWTVAVRTWGFIESHLNMSVSGDTATFDCRGSSPRQPIELSMYVENEGRVDDKPEFQRTIAQEGQETRMTLAVPTSYLRFPRSLLTCKLKNEAEEKTEYQYISNYIVPDYYENTDYPYMQRNKSRVVDNLDGSTTIECTATGKQPMEMRFYIDTPDYDGLIKDDSMSSRNHTIEGGEMTTTLVIPTANLKWPKSWLYCDARNTLGEDKMDVNLSDVIVDYYYK